MRNAVRAAIAKHVEQLQALRTFDTEYPARYAAGNLDEWIAGGDAPHDIDFALAHTLDDIRNQTSRRATPTVDTVDVLSEVRRNIQTALARAADAADRTGEDIVAALIDATEAAELMRTKPSPTHLDALTKALKAAGLPPPALTGAGDSVEQVPAVADLHLRHWSRHREPVARSPQM